MLDSRKFGVRVEVVRVQDGRALIHRLAVLPVETVGRNVRLPVFGLFGLVNVPILLPQVADAFAFLRRRVRVVALGPGQHHLVRFRLPAGIGGKRLGKVVGLNRRRGHDCGDLLAVSGKPHEGLFDFLRHLADLSFALRRVVVLQVVEDDEVRAEYAFRLSTRSRVKADGLQYHARRRERAARARVNHGRQHDLSGGFSRLRRLAVVLLGFRPLVCALQFQERQGDFWEVLNERRVLGHTGENVLDDVFGVFVVCGDCDDVAAAACCGSPKHSAFCVCRLAVASGDADVVGDRGVADCLFHVPDDRAHFQRRRNFEERAVVWIV